MPHFFLRSENIFNNKGVIEDKENYTHIAKSLRAKCGEQLLIIDENEIQYETVISDITKNSIEFEIKKSYKSKRKLNYDIYVAISPLNSNAILTVFEKLTELGVRGFYPIYTDNCAVKKSIIENKVPKWQKVCYEAFKQCERADVPICYQLAELKDVISLGFDKILCFTERSAKFEFKPYLENNNIKQGDKILVVIGPEGGFSKREFEYLNNFDTISLGELILKADTASIVAVGNIIYENTINKKN